MTRRSAFLKAKGSYMKFSSTGSTYFYDWLSPKTKVLTTTPALVRKPTETLYFVPAIIVAFLIVAFTYYCWRRNRRLEMEREQRRLAALHEFNNLPLGESFHMVEQLPRYEPTAPGQDVHLGGCDGIQYAEMLAIANSVNVNDLTNNPIPFDQTDAPPAYQDIANVTN